MSQDEKQKCGKTLGLCWFVWELTFLAGPTFQFWIYVLLLTTGAYFNFPSDETPARLEAAPTFPRRFQALPAAVSEPEVAERAAL